MMDPWSLTRAMEGTDAVITSAAGYTRHRKGDTPATDTMGNTNLVEAAARAGVRRFVLTSILTCDETPQVPHFWHKKLMEDRLEGNSAYRSWRCGRVRSWTRSPGSAVTL